MQALLENLFDLEDKKTTAGKWQEVWAEYDVIVTEGGWASQPKQGSPDLLA